MNLNKLILISILIVSLVYSQCENDYTNYGSESCDTAWEQYGLNCVTLSSYYNWDCSGCFCPGDEGSGNGNCWDTVEGGSWVDCNGDGWDIDITGCTDENADNYNPDAEIDDGSCDYGNDGTPCYETECGFYIESGYSCEEIILYYGYDCSACEEECGHDEGDGEDCNDGEVSDCTDNDCCPESWIGDGFGDCEDQAYGCDLTCYENDGGDCQIEDIYGCTDLYADNFNPDATIDDESCLYNGCLNTQCTECVNQEFLPNCNGTGCNSCYSFNLGDGFCDDGDDGYVCDLTCYNNDNGDCNFQQEEFSIELELTYPQAGDHIEDYTNIEVRWNYEGDSPDSSGVYLSFNCSYKTGGGLIEVANGIPIEQGSAFVDLSYATNGEPIDAETIFANFKIIASDSHGNSTDDQCSDYFIIGNPEGEANTNYINEEDATIILDWAWIEDQTIVITDEAIATLQEFDYIKIFDEAGIHTDYCQDDGANSNGFIELADIDIREQIGTKTVTLPCGFDYCDEGGTRIRGYLPTNTIKFAAGFDQGDDLYDLAPYSGQLIGETMSFDNETYIIDAFTLGDRINTNNINYSDGREWDEFNVYGKVTNHQGGSNRSCNHDEVCDVGESLVDCFDDCCAIPGTGENDEWCLLETVNTITNFVDNLTNGNYAPYVPAGTSSATFNYRVWLLDDEQNEVVKTIDTEINYESDEMIAYQKDLATGWNWTSLNVGTDDYEITNIFSNTSLVATDYIKGQTLSSIYYVPGDQWYPIWDMDVQNSYLININSDSEVLYYGSYIQPSSVDITVDSGWNWISYVPQNILNIQADNALSSLSLQGGDYIKGQTTSSIYYVPGDQWYPDIELNPTEGYLLKTNSSGTLTYPDPVLNNNDTEPLYQSYIDNSIDFNYHEFEFNASATIEIAINDIVISKNDRISVYKDQELRGIIYGDKCPLNNKIMFNLMFYSNKEHEENLNFVYYNSISNTEYDISEKMTFNKDDIIGNVYEPLILTTNNILPSKFELSLPYPNPFNPTTKIDFTLPQMVENLTLSIYDITGRLIEVLYSGKMDYGQHSFIWNASSYSSGIYFVKMSTNNQQFTQKISLVK